MPQEKSFIDILDYCLKYKNISPPVFNKTGMQIREEVAREEPDNRVIEKIITCDQALTSEVLRTAHSVFFKGLSLK